MAGDAFSPASLHSSGRRRSSKSLRRRERGVLASLAGATSLSVFVTLAITLVLGSETVSFFSRFEEVSLLEFLTGGTWSPQLGSTKHFGIWPLISGTLLIASIALSVAVPLGLVTAIYLSEYAHPRVRAFIKPALELLAGIPTVVYGFLALTLITPVIRGSILPSLGMFNALSAGIAVGILILPIVASLAEDAFRAVPQSLRDGVYGLGGTRFDAAVKVVFPAATSGVVSAVLLAMARAVGETMIVALAAGSMARLTLDPTSEVQTITGFMVQMALGDVSNFGVEYFSMYAVAFVLFVMTMVLTIIGAIIRRRFREEYE
ncbi:MAG: phosphate ABC transporter permease subunit PstC [Planctomycetes bacterium]|nr:phosphate ABC transporter permease subunit PstC [Planctomycetota bacterium]